MRARSWMAALALIAGTLIAVGRAVPALVSSPTQDQGQAQDTKKAEPRSQTTTPKPPDSRIPAVQLNLVIAGLSREGCDVEVKPGNASCKFSVAQRKRGAEGRQHVSSEGRAKLQLRDVEFAAPTAPAPLPSRCASRDRPSRRSTAASVWPLGRTRQGPRPPLLYPSSLAT